MDPITFFAVLLWMAVAKGAVYLLEDASYAVRGKQSPRQKERAAHRAAEAAGQPLAAPSGAWGRTRAAVGGYLAGVVEDATASARARQRRSQARKAGSRAVDGVFVDLADEDGFYADCDVCGWSSRKFRIERNALAAGREHTRTEHPEHYHPDPTPAPADQGDQGDEGDEQSPPVTPGQDGSRGEEPVGERPKFTVLPGGADDIEPAAPLPTGRAALDVGDDTPLLHRALDLVVVTQFASTTLLQRRLFCDYAQAQRLLDALERAGVIGPASGSGSSRQVLVRTPDELDDLFGDGWQNPPAAGPAEGEAADAPQPAATAVDDEGLMDLIEATQDSGAGTPAGTGEQDNPGRSTTVNTEAMGADEIRAAFTEAITATEEPVNELGGLASALAESADAYEARQMAGSTVEQIREGAEAMKAAVAQLENAREHLEAALADFNAKDGVVADTVTDVGNLADRSVLVGG
ncbi:DNA translocase FtsK [Actinoplanes siamensis]|uniref:FtsK gamma domain-containing protein n=1 Tax=Actinoplanes siamensis TaxID=1223317 RepID=A0A919TNL8_9ACTN|nr:DNA translocase FtsK [Actinoplanes siamensis]GIF08872.1 hypothetical protein Asi03nite_64100 [Actinoplanes siamensis]